MDDEYVMVSVCDDYGDALCEVRVGVSKMELDQFVSDFEEHFARNYDDVELQ